MFARTAPGVQKMPNRIIKESICTSDEIDSLTPEQEVFFYRLMVNCDDFGLFDARPKIVASKCYPLKSIDISQIQSMLAALCEIGLVRVYEVDGRPYLSLVKWAEHQQIRAKRSKYPTPEMGRDISCNQLISNVHVIQSNPIQSESNPSEAKASGGEPPKALTPDEIIFGYGIPLLTNAGTADKQARSFLGGLRKQHGETALIDKLRECIRAKPLQPLEWLAAALPPPGSAASARNKPPAENFETKDYGTGGRL